MQRQLEDELVMKAELQGRVASYKNELENTQRVYGRVGTSELVEFFGELSG